MFIFVSLFFSTSTPGNAIKIEIVGSAFNFQRSLLNVFLTTKFEEQKLFIFHFRRFLIFSARSRSKLQSTYHRLYINLRFRFFSILLKSSFQNRWSPIIILLILQILLKTNLKKNNDPKCTSAYLTRSPQLFKDIFEGTF